MNVARSDNELHLTAHTGQRLVWTAACELTMDGHVWRRAPWPVDDDAFALAEPSDRSVVVAAGDSERRSAALDALADRGLAATTIEHVPPEAIRDAAVVVLLADGHLPAAGMTVPAAGRLLVTVDCATTFGLLPGVDHLAAESEEVAAALVDVAVDQWDALTTMRKLGRRAAERHRASVVYPRLDEDLAIESSSGASGRTAG